MKNYYYRATALLLCVLFCAASLRSTAQVTLNYAAYSDKIFEDHKKNLVITGKRIANPNVNLNPPGTYTEGNAISLFYCDTVIISNCIIGPTGGSGIYLRGCNYVIITNCIFYDNSSCIRAETSSDVKIYNNQFINPQNNVALPLEGGEGAYVSFGDMSKACEIRDNVGECILNHSNPQDLISIIACAMPYTNPMLIANNKFRGGGPSMHGGGIMVGDDCDTSFPTRTAYVTVKNNRLVNAGQYGLNITGGSHLTLDSNYVYSADLPWSNMGITVSDGYARGGCTDNIVTNNKINFTHHDFPPYPYPWASDYNCGAFTNRETENDFNSSIDETILPDRILNPFPIAYLKFDQNLYDTSGSRLHATAYGTAGIVCDTYRKAAYFNGTSSDVMNLPRSPSLKPSSQMITVSAWIKPSATSNIQGILRSQDSDGWSDGWRCALNGTTFGASLMTDNGRAEVYSSGITSGVWNHIAFTYDGKVMKGYINGTLVSTDTKAGTILYTYTTPLAIGGSEGTTNFGGLIAEVKIMYGVMNDTEISDDYYLTKGSFDGTTSAASTPYNYSTYYANSSSVGLTANSWTNVLPNSFGTISTYVAGASGYNWTVDVAGDVPSYFNPYGSYVDVSVNPYSTVRVNLEAQYYCAAPVRIYFELYGDYTAPLRIKYQPQTQKITVEENPAEPAVKLKNGSRAQKIIIPSRSTKYSVEVYNILGQRLKSGIYRLGDNFTLDIGGLASGVYFVRIADQQGIVHSQQIFKQ